MMTGVLEIVLCKFYSKNIMKKLVKIDIDGDLCAGWLVHSVDAEGFFRFSTPASFVAQLYLVESVNGMVSISQLPHNIVNCH